MKTTRITKLTLSLTGTLFIINTLQAQSPTPPLNQTSTISLISTDSASLNNKSRGQLWGYTFGDYAFVAHGDSAGRGTSQQYKGLDSKAPGNPGQNQNAFEIRRAYLGYDYKINNKFSGSALLAYEGDNDANNNRTVYLKEAFLTWANIFKGSMLKLGQQATNSFSNAHNTVPLMGYRSIERSILDMHKVDGSSDMGITLEGRLWTFKRGDSTRFPSFIGYSIMIGDNTGNTPVAGFTSSSVQAVNGTTSRDKKFRGNAYVNTFNGALTIGIYSDFINYGNVYYKTSKGYQDAVYTIKGYAVYNSKWFGIGFEWFKQSNTNGEIETWAKGEGTNDTATASQSGLSIFAHGTIIQNKLNIFARYDTYSADDLYSNTANETFASRIANPSGNTFTTTPYKENFINGGVDWTPTKDKKVHFMPNIWYYQIKNGYGSDALRSDYYLVYRLTFLYILK